MTDPDLSMTQEEEFLLLTLKKVLQPCIAVAYKPPALTHLHIITVLRAEINLSEGSWALHEFAANAAITNQHNLHLSS